jgi:hypothetical protein
MIGALLMIASAVVSAAPATAQEGLSMMRGRWSDPQENEVVIEKGPFGYNTWLAWIGKARITPSGGVGGSDIKIESADTGVSSGIVCYYSVNFQGLEPGRRLMGWNRKPGSTPGCPLNGKYYGVVSY